MGRCVMWEVRATRAGLRPPHGDSKVEGGELVRRGREDGERELLFAVLGEELLVTRVGAEVGEVGAGVEGGEIAVAGLECLLQGGEGFVFVAFRGVDGGQPVLIDCRFLRIGLR